MSKYETYAKEGKKYAQMYEEALEKYSALARKAAETGGVMMMEGEQGEENLKTIFDFCVISLRLSQYLLLVQGNQFAKPILMKTVDTIDGIIDGIAMKKMVDGMAQDIADDIRRKTAKKN